MKNYDTKQKKKKKKKFIVCTKPCDERSCLLIKIVLSFRDKMVTLLEDLTMREFWTRLTLTNPGLKAKSIKAQGDKKVQGPMLTTNVKFGY